MSLVKAYKDLKDKKFNLSLMRPKRFLTGIESFDEVITIEYGNMIEILGEEETCKTSLGYKMLYSAMNENRTCVLIDTKGELSLDIEMFGDSGALTYSRTNIIEDCFGIVGEIYDHVKNAVVLIDSLIGLTAKKNFNSKLTDGTDKDLDLETFKASLSWINEKLKASNGILILINDLIRYQNTARGRGGRALSFLTDLRLLMTNVELRKEDRIVKCTVLKGSGLNVNMKYNYNEGWI